MPISSGAVINATAAIELSADVPLQKSSVADGAETYPHRSLPQGILKRWIGWLARRLAGRFRLGRPYAVKIAAASFRHRHPYMLRIKSFHSSSPSRRLLRMAAAV